MIPVLYINPFSYIGGGEMSLLTVLRNLDRRRWKPYVACYAEGPLVEQVRAMGIEVVVFARTGILSNFSIVYGLYRFIAKNSIRLVHVNSLDIRAAAASLLAGAPYIGHLRVIFPFSWRDRWFVRMSSKTIAVSNATVKMFCKKRQGCIRKFAIIPNPVDISAAITPVDLKGTYGFPADSFVVGAVGRIDPMKGFEYFIEAAARVRQMVPAARFLVVGAITTDDPREKEYLRKLTRRIEESGLQKYCILAGFRKDILNVIAGFDIMAVPSVTTNTPRGVIGEGFGRGAVEAMALGVPVIVSNSGGLPEIVENGVSGLVVPSADAVALAQAVVDLARDSGKRAGFAAAGRRRFESLYTCERHLDSLENVYGAALGAEKIGRPCDVCSAELFKVREHCRGGFRVMQCVNCGFAFVHPFPSAEQLAANYSADYYAPWFKERADRIRMWDARLDLVDRIAEHKGKLLDVGCGEGLFLERASSGGWEVRGTEISEFAVSHISKELGIEVFKGGLAESQFTDNYFDCVTMWHSLEHTPDPAQVIRAAQRMIKPGGMLIIAVPNLDNAVFRFFYRLARFKRPHLFDPADRELHLCHFNPGSLKALLESNGFQVIQITPDGGIIGRKRKALDAISRFISRFSGRLSTEAFMIIAGKPL
jgi:glycosyltransferase involved in cell wall biosynthesis/SAM-dependent methyltransferase